MYDSIITVQSTPVEKLVRHCFIVPALALITIGGSGMTTTKSATGSAIASVESMLPGMSACTPTDDEFAEMDNMFAEFNEAVSYSDLKQLAAEIKNETPLNK